MSKKASFEGRTTQPWWRDTEGAGIPIVVFHACILWFLQYFVITKSLWLYGITAGFCLVTMFGLANQAHKREKRNKPPQKVLDALSFRLGIGFLVPLLGCFFVEMAPQPELQRVEDWQQFETDFANTYNTTRTLIFASAALWLLTSAILRWKLGSWRAFWYWPKQKSSNDSFLRYGTITAFWFLLFLMMFLLGYLPKGDTPVQEKYKQHVDQEISATTSVFFYDFLLGQLAQREKQNNEHQLKLDEQQKKLHAEMIAHNEVVGVEYAQILSHSNNHAALQITLKKLTEVRIRKQDIQALSLTLEECRKNIEEKRWEAQHGTVQKGETFRQLLSYCAQHVQSSSWEIPEDYIKGTTQQLFQEYFSIPTTEVFLGESLLGTKLKEPLYADNPQRMVSLNKTLLVMKHEVTQGVWMAMMGANPSYNQNCGRKCPVENISWFQAIEFANKLSAQQKLSSCYQVQATTVQWIEGCQGWRLPTEQEWEFIAQGGAHSNATSTLNSFAGTPEWKQVAWGYQNSQNSTQIVGKKKSNAFGVFDMSGNVSEWVWSSYHVHIKDKKESYTSTGAYRVFRGGSYRSQPVYLSVFFRNMRAPIFRHKTIGVRLVREQNTQP